MIDEELTDNISPDERRQHDRSRLIVDVHFDGADSTGIASTKDISPGGVYMSTRTQIPVGATLALRIPIGSNHIVVKAEVVYSNPGEGVGVKFRELSDEARALMGKLVPHTRSLPQRKLTSVCVTRARSCAARSSRRNPAAKTPRISAWNVAGSATTR